MRSMYPDGSRVDNCNSLIGSEGKKYGCVLFRPGADNRVVRPVRLKCGTGIVENEGNSLFRPPIRARLAPNSPETAQSRRSLSRGDSAMNNRKESVWTRWDRRVDESRGAIETGPLNFRVVRRNPVFPYDRSFEIRFDCHDRATLFFERIYIYI